MPFNLLKIYNDKLELSHLTERERNISLMGVFNRDIAENNNFKFNNKQINPTPIDGKIKIDLLFTHLTTEITDKATNKREFDIHRSCRLHWLRYHIENKKENNMFIFSTKEPNGYRTYIYDKCEMYVIILEPLRKINEYYLLTAYNLRGKDKAKDKMMNKYKRRLPYVL